MLNIILSDDNTYTKQVSIYECTNVFVHLCAVELAWIYKKKRFKISFKMNRIYIYDQ